MASTGKYQLVGGSQKHSYILKITKYHEYKLGKVTAKCFICDWQMEDNSLTFYWEDVSMLSLISKYL